MESRKVALMESKRLSIISEKPIIDRIDRPWGSFNQYAYNTPVTVSLMMVDAGQQLSFQSHTERSELWIVFDSGAKVQVDDQTYYPEPGEEIWIPVNAKHRLTSLGPPVRVLEVAFGNWQQDDIVRYADDYDRPEQGE